jgi:GNAT superfamily N-acetyltransferase
MFRNLVEKIKFNKKYGRRPTIEQFIQEWSTEPEKHFFGYFDQELEWSTTYSTDFEHGLPSSHCYSFFPDIRCQFKAFGYRLLIGNIEIISMHSVGVVCIKHFALDPDLTRHHLGKTFFNAILRFFKSKNAVVIEFHENHSSKIEYYRRFFEKLGIEEVKDRVWRVNLYDDQKIPEHVLAFHNSLKDENCPKN